MFPRTWLDSSLGGSDTVGLTWLALTAFIRISTKIGLFPDPLTPAEAIAQAQDWVAAPGAEIVEPSPAHLVVLEQLLKPTGTGGNLVSDAHLAAIALEHRATIVSYDSDFARFGDLKWQTPDECLPT